eukprot:scaffold22244_cov62-Phaeocystis_antarctica.AAC.1
MHQGVGFRVGATGLVTGVSLAAHLRHHHAQAALQQPRPRVGAAWVVLEAEAGVDDGQREVGLLGAVEHKQ